MGCANGICISNLPSLSLSRLLPLSPSLQREREREIRNTHAIRVKCAGPVPRTGEIPDRRRFLKPSTVCVCLSVPRIHFSYRDRRASGKTHRGPGCDRRRWYTFERDETYTCLLAPARAVIARARALPLRLKSERVGSARGGFKCRVIMVIPHFRPVTVSSVLH